MNYFSLFAILCVCCSIDLNAMNFERTDSIYQQPIQVQQDVQNRPPRLQLKVTPYKDLSDAMQAEEHLVANLQTMCNSYMCVLNTRRALLDNGADIRVIREYDDSINTFWYGVNDIINCIRGSRQSVKFLTILQYSMAGTPEPFLGAQQANNQNQQPANMPQNLCNQPPAKQN